MCGLYGALKFNGGPVEPGLAEAMAKKVARRGPDDQGEWFDGPVMLGHVFFKIAVGKLGNRAFLALPCFFTCRVAAQLDAGERLLGCLSGLVRR